MYTNMFLYVFQIYCDMLAKVMFEFVCIHVQQGCSSVPCLYHIKAKIYHNPAKLAHTNDSLFYMHP
jgi:hypothetical protein